MRRTLLSAALLMAAVAVSAGEQRTIGIDTYSHAGPFTVKAPLMLDSLDVNSKGFDPARGLLEQKVNTDALKGARTWTGTELPGVPDGDDCALHLMGLTLRARSYFTGELKLEQTPKNYELYLDGRKHTPGKLTLEPGDHLMVIKYLAEKDHRDSLKINIETESATDVSAHEYGAAGGVYNVEKMMQSIVGSGVSLSPDGDYMLVVKSQRAAGQNRYWYNVTELKTGRVVSDNRRVEWMPRSNRYYYTETGTDGRRIITVDPATGAEEILATNIPEGRFEISYDEKHLLYATETQGPEELNKGVFEVLTPDDRQPGWRSRSGVAIYDIESGLMQPVTYGYHNFYLHDITEDCHYALIAKYEDLYEGRPTSVISYFRVDLNTMHADTLVYRDGFVSGGQFSPDGTRVLFQGSPEAFDRIGCTLPQDITPSMYDYQAYILDIPQNGTVNPETCKINPVTKDFDPSADEMEWSHADGMIYLKAANKDSVSIFRLDPKDGSIAMLDLPEENIKYMSLAYNAPVIALCGQSAMNSDRIYTAQLNRLKVKDGKIALPSLECVEDLSAKTLEGIEVAQCNAWTFMNSNGDEVLCRYYLPVGFDETSERKYPMITYYYGGCSPVERMFESSYPWQIWASLGYAVLVVEPSGAAGFGQEWASRHVNTAGKDPARDIIEAVKEFCATHTFINSSKVGCCGASYGGFMTQYLQTVTDIFACAISHAGISDHTTYWGYGYWGYSYSEVSMANSYPWSETELYVKNSPIYNVDKIHTPLLFLHGTADTNVPINNSIQMFTALKLLGRETAMVCVDGENHGITEYNKRISWLKTSLAWFAKYLQDDPTWWDALYPEKAL